jgi:hypothetical protein
MKDNENDKINGNDEEKLQVGDDKLKIGDPIAALRKLSDEHRKAELIAESEREREAAEFERKRREAYERQLADERRELLKRKAGIVEVDVNSEEEETEEVKMPLGKRIGNFWYHNKFTVIVPTIVVVAFTYFIGELIFKVEPDVKIMYIASDYQISVLYKDIAEALVPYCPDFNGDGKIYVEVSYTPAIVDQSQDPNYHQAMSAKLYVEFSSDQTILFFVDEEAVEFLDITENVFENPADFDYKAGTYNDLGYLVSATDLAELIGYSDLDPNLVAAFRFPQEGMGKLETAEQNYKNAHILWENFITGNVVSPDAVNYSRS